MRHPALDASQASGKTISKNHDKTYLITRALAAPGVGLIKNEASEGAGAPGAKPRSTGATSHSWI